MEKNGRMNLQWVVTIFPNKHININVFYEMYEHIEMCNVSGNMDKRLYILTWEQYNAE
jgi:hypothetical protein